MWKDPIVDEIRKAREAHAARFDYDLKAIYCDLKQQEKNSGRTFVSYPLGSADLLRKLSQHRNLS